MCINLLILWFHTFFFRFSIFFVPFLFFFLSPSLLQPSCTNPLGCPTFDNPFHPSIHSSVHISMYTHPSIPTALTPSFLHSPRTLCRSSIIFSTMRCVFVCFFSNWSSFRTASERVWGGGRRRPGWSMPGSGGRDTCRGWGNRPTRMEQVLHCCCRNPFDRLISVAYVCIYILFDAVHFTSV